MKIAYLTTYDPADVHAWSGLGFHIRKSLTAQRFEVDSFGPLPPYRGIRSQVLRARGIWFNRVLQGKSGFFSSERDITIAKFRADSISQRLKETKYDAIVSPGTLPVALLNTDIPIVIWADATFRSLTDAYPGLDRMTAGYYADGEALERAALSNARLCVYASEWAAQSAIKDYGVDPARVLTIPFGPNTETNDACLDLRRAISEKSRGPAKLLFLGIDFERKGGRKTLAVLRELRELGVRAELEIIGCAPSIPDDLKSCVRCHGFISKAYESGRHLVQNALYSAHWLLLLSSAECYGLVLCEANSRGVPCIANEVGGIPTIIRNDKNGKLFPLTASPQEIARYIAAVPATSERYATMAAASYAEYSTRLNWQAAGRTLATAIRSL